MQRAQASNNQYAILGSLVHRAVLMPMDKQLLVKRRGRAVTFATSPAAASFSLKSRTKFTAEKLHDLLTERHQELLAERDSVPNYWDLDSAIIDSSGPTWSGLLDDFLALSARERAYVLSNLVHASVRAAEAIETFAFQERWRSVQSEVQFMTEIGTNGKISEVRVDLVAITRDGNVDVVDLKTTSTVVPDIPFKKRPDQCVARQRLADRHKDAIEAFKSLTDPRVCGVLCEADPSWWILEVSTEPDPRGLDWAYAEMNFYVSDATTEGENPLGSPNGVTNEIAS